MNSSVTVSTVEPKVSSGGKNYLLFTDSTGKKWTFWNGQDKVWGLIKPGAQFDIEWEQDGKYQNIKGMTFKGEVPPPPPPEPPISHEKQASIEAQNARTNLTALCIAGKLTEAEETKLIMQLCSFAGIHYDTEEPLVEAVKAQGGVETISGMKPARKA